MPPRLMESQLPPPTGSGPARGDHGREVFDGPGPFNGGWGRAGGGSLDFARESHVSRDGANGGDPELCGDGCDATDEAGSL